LLFSMCCCNHQFAGVKYHTLEALCCVLDHHYLTHSIHNGELTGYNFGFMTTLNNTVLADMPTYVTHSANDPSFLVVTSLLPGRTFSYWLLKTQLNKNWHKDVFLYINPLNAKLYPICHLLALLAHHIFHVGRIRVNVDSEVTQPRSSYLMFQWKSTLHHKFWALSYCYIRVSTQLR
jgi:hypothetical protein